MRIPRACLPALLLLAPAFAAHAQEPATYRHQATYEVMIQEWDLPRYGAALLETNCLWIGGNETFDLVAGNAIAAWTPRDPTAWELTLYWFLWDTTAGGGVTGPSPLALDVPPTHVAEDQLLLVGLGVPYPGVTVQHPASLTVDLTFSGRMPTILLSKCTFSGQ